jgi:hypothetical protein
MILDKGKNIHDTILMISKSEKMLKSTKQQKKKLNSRLKNTQSKTLIIFLNLSRFASIFFSVMQLSNILVPCHMIDVGQVQGT